MKFTIDNSIFESFPDVKIAALKCKIGKPPSKEKAESFLRDKEEIVRSKLDLEAVTASPVIQDWRNAYRAFGKKPSMYRPSVEALLRRVVKGGNLPSINPLVDVYNAISISHILPMGGDDIDHLDGDLILTRAKGNELFTMLGSESAETVDPNEVIYRDEKEVTCRAWNFRECNKTRIRDDSQNVLLVMEGLGGTSKEDLEGALEDLKQAVLNISEDAEVTAYYLDKNTASLDI